MKTILSFIFILLLVGCSNPAGKAVKALGCTVKECCSTISIRDKNAGGISSASAKSSLPSVPASFQDILGSEMLTW